MLVGLAALFYWKGMRKKVDDYVKCCLVCQQTKYSTQVPGGYVGGCIYGLHYRFLEFKRSHDYSCRSGSFHEALYGRLPLLVIPYPLGTSKVAAVDDLLVERDELLCQPKENLLAAKHIMEIKANIKCREVEFMVEDMVLVKHSLIANYRLALPVCDVREVLKNGEPTRQVLVQWVEGSPEEATWEWLSEFQKAYPNYNLEDKVAFEDRRNDTPTVKTRGRTARIKKVPGWQRDFVMG
ncbi:ty3-gypsy retrotransposon protein [Tanacetum coccineum]